MIFVLSLITAFSLYYGFRSFLWRSELIPAVQRILYNKACKTTFYEMYRIIYIQVAAIFFISMFTVWVFTDGVNDQHLKLTSGFVLLGLWIWIKGVIESR